MTHISYHCSLFLPHQGGIETTVDAMSRYVISRGDKADIVTKRYPETLSARENIRGVPINRYVMPWTVNKMSDLCFQLGVWYAEHSDVSIIHAVGLRRPLPFLSVLLGGLFNIPVVLSACGTDVPANRDAASLKTWSEGQEYMTIAVTTAGALTAVSKDTQEDLYRAVPAIRGLSKVIHCGVDVNDLDQAKPYHPSNFSGPFILSLRRLEPDKGIDVLLQAMRLLIDKHGDRTPHLVIAGDGSSKRQLVQQASMLRIMPWVHFIGTVPHNIGMGLLKVASVCVVPSLVEGGGLVNTEANTLGCPIVASDVGGIREYVSPEASILVPPLNPSALADGIEQYLSSSSKRRRAKIAGREFGCERDWSNIFPQYEKVYQSALAPCLDRVIQQFPQAQDLADSMIQGKNRSERS